MLVSADIDIFCTTYITLKWIPHLLGKFERKISQILYENSPRKKASPPYSPGIWSCLKRQTAPLWQLLVGTGTTGKRKPKSGLLLLLLLWGGGCVWVLLWWNSCKVVEKVVGWISVGLLSPTHGSHVRREQELSELIIGLNETEILQDDLISDCFFFYLFISFFQYLKYLAILKFFVYSF